MGTRGFVGFVVDGQEKIAYNHFDSYPDGLGRDVIEWIQSDFDNQTADKVRALRAVDEDVPPTPEEIERLKKYADTRVSTRSLTEWYVLLRQTQGSIGAILDAGYYEDAGDFPLDSLYAEWGYLINLDDDTLEIYRGFVEEPPVGRFADRSGVSGNGYAACTLLATYKLDEMLSADADQVVRDLSKLAYPDSEEED